MGALVVLLYLAGRRGQQMIHSDTPGHQDEVVSAEVQVPQRIGGEGREVKKDGGGGASRVAPQISTPINHTLHGGGPPSSVTLTALRMINT